MSTVVTHSELDTISLGKRFAQRLKTGDVVAIYGELGTGKTRFIKGICEGLGVQEHVASPTFTIVNEYGYPRLTDGQASSVRSPSDLRDKFPGGKVYHFDFYRVNSIHEIREVGFEEYVNNDGICVIEWADRAKELLPDRRYDVRLTLGTDENERTITIEEPAEVLS